MDLEHPDDRDGLPSPAVARQLLGLLHDVRLTDELVRKAYKKLALRWHPDKNKHPDAKAQFQRLYAAHEVLLSTGGELPCQRPRRRHDRPHARGGANAPAAAGQHACPSCDEPVFPPDDPASRLFRCPVCRHILRNPFFDAAAAADRRAAAATDGGRAGGSGSAAAEEAVAVTGDAALVVGARVVVKGRFSDGVVRFVGATHFADGDWIGVELDSPLGKHDGAVRGQRYFSCRPRHGLFLRPDQLHLKAKLDTAVDALASDALRVFTGALDPRTCDEGAASVVWRCRTCAPSSSSVCCRVSERRGVCVCGHKLASHRDKRGAEPAGRRAFACVGKCPCPGFRYHIQQGGWSAKCNCKHKHTDHDPVTEKCRKMIPGRKPCPCSSYSVKWVCNCGHPADEHETVVVAANSTSTFSNTDLAREWVCGGVRPEIRNEAAANRLKWAAKGRAPRTASSAAREVVANDGRTIPVGRTTPSSSADARDVVVPAAVPTPFYKYREPSHEGGSGSGGSGGGGGGGSGGGGRGR